MVMTSCQSHAKTTKQTPNATYKTTKVKFSELKLPTPNLLSKAKPLNVLILRIEGYDVRKRIRVK